MGEGLREKFKSSATTAPLLVIFVIIAMQTSKFSLANLQSETNVFVAIGVIQLITLGLPCMVYYLLKGRKLAEPVYVVSSRGPQVLFVFFAALLFVSGMLLIKFFYFVGGGTEAAVVNFYSDATGTYEGTSQTEIVLAFIIIPAILEELLFRGIIFSEYRKFGTANAVIVSAICFSMLHFSLESFFVYLFIGILFGFVTAMTRSIFPSIALHMLSNILSIYASDAFLRVTVVKNGAYFVGFVLAVLTALSLILLLSRVETICHSYADNPPMEAMPPKSSSHWTEVFFSPMFIILVIVFFVVVLFMQ